MQPRTSLVAALLLGAVAVSAGCSGGDERPVSADPSASPTAVEPPARTAASVIAGGRLLDLATAGGAALGLYQECPQDADDLTCRTAWRIPRAGEEGLLPGQLGWTVTAAADRFVLTRADGRRARIVDPSGRTRAVATGEGPVGADVLTAGVPSPGPRGIDLVDPRRAVRFAVPRPEGVDRWQTVTTDGSGGLWGFAVGDGESAHMQVWHSADGSVWRSTSIALPRRGVAFPAYLAASGEHAAALAGYDGATLLPVAALAVTADAGRTWTTLGAREVPFDYVDAMVAGPDGTLYVLGESGADHAVPRLYRSTDDAWDSFTPVPMPRDVRPAALTRSGGDVLLRADGGRYLTVGPDGATGDVRRFGA